MYKTRSNQTGQIRFRQKVEVTAWEKNVRMEGRQLY